MAALTFAPRVAEDLRDIGDWIAQNNPDRAITFIEELAAACHDLTDFPLAYPPIPCLVSPRVGAITVHTQSSMTWSTMS